MISTLDPIIRKCEHIAIIVPCLNEEAIILQNFKALSLLTNSDLKAIKVSVIYVDDGSVDGTWAQIVSLAKVYSTVSGLKLSRNFGHQAALLAGMCHALTLSIDCMITLDCDLQDDIAVIPNMIDLWCQGFEIVLGVRNDRRSDSIFKRFSAQIFYKLLTFMGCPLVVNHGDFRLLGRNSSHALTQVKNQFLFLRAEVIKIGFCRTSVYYSRLPGLHSKGDTRYPTPKMLELAASALTSYSLLPLRLILPMGLLVSLTSIAWLAFIVLSTLFLGRPQPGWASLMCVILLGTSLNLIAIGILAEYLGRLCARVDRNSNYLIEKLI
jgi:glycosyltransferase involved in cell wall biosynthesis